MEKDEKTKKVKKSQTSDVLEYMQNHRCITNAIAIDKFGAYRLSDIIFRLRNKGHLIQTNIVSKENRYGNISSYAEYSLVR